MAPPLIIYQVQIRIPCNLQTAYQDWLINHVVGNTAAGIPGMLELKTREGRSLFVKANILGARSPQNADDYLYRVNYYLEELSMMTYYEQHFAAYMRTQLPEAFVGLSVVNRCLYLPELIGDWQEELGEEQKSVSSWETILTG